MRAVMLTNVSVIYIDPFSSTKVTFDGKSFGVPKLRGSKIASRVSYGDISIHSFKINASMTEGELKTLVEIKMYEEAGLDLQKRYKIVYIKKELELSETALVEAFAIEESKTRKTLETVLKEEKYLDFLALPFLAFSTLYHNKILAPKNDVFVYIERNEAFLSIYKDARYISTKSIMNLEEIVKRLKREEVDIDSEALKKLLLEKGLDASAYAEDELSLSTALQTVFVEIFTKINDIFMHNRNVFGLDSIDRIFMSTANGRIRGLREFLHAFGYTETTLHDFKLFKECSTENVFACLMASYVCDQYALENQSENITFLVRPPQFFKTEVGKVALISAASLLIAGLYPLYLMLEIEQFETQRSELSTQNEAMKKNSAKFNADLVKIKNELKSATEAKVEQETALNNIAKSVDELYAMKLTSKTYVDFIVSVNGLLKTYGLMVRSIEQKNSDKMVIEVVAMQNQRDTIAKFMEALIAQGFVGVSTDEVRSEKALYISKIEIAR